MNVVFRAALIEYDYSGRHPDGFVYSVEIRNLCSQVKNIEANRTKCRETKLERVERRIVSDELYERIRQEGVISTMCFELTGDLGPYKQFLH